MAGRSSADWTRLRELFLSYRAGDADSARALYAELLRVVRAYFLLRLSSQQDAEDLAQAALLKIHFARASYDPGRPLKTWIFTIASRSLIDHWRGRAGRGGGDGTDEAPDELPQEGLAEPLRIDLQRDLTAALAVLKPIDRQIVYLYAVEGFGMAEIGAMLGLTESAVKLRAHRSYGKLRERLG